MEPVVCLNCYEFFPPSPRHKNQRYCMKPPCRRAKKAAWKRHKMATDPDFKLDQKLSNQKWAQNKPGYWKDYRERIPKKRNAIASSSQFIKNDIKRPNFTKSNNFVEYLIEYAIEMLGLLRGLNNCC